MSLNRRDFLKTIGAGSLSLCIGGLQYCSLDKKIRPNIIYINIDDLGWKDLGLMGSEYYETPYIDKLAREGVVFTDAYAPSANCAPSRASCMTGLYAPRHGIYTVNSSERGDPRTRKLIPVENQTVLPDSFVTIAESLKQNGYVTAHMGKWHLGEDPRTQGFDVNIAGNTFGHPPSYFSPYKNPNLEDGPEGEYLPDRLTTEAIRFVKNNQSRPFFLHMSYYAVHSPLQPKPEKQEKYLKKKGSAGQNNAKYAAMVESVDDNVGRLLDLLDELRLSERTVVVFTSDNGGVRRFTSMAPLRAGKGSFYEGGIRVPMIVRWPEKIQSGTQCHTPVSGIDIYPTFLELASTPKPIGTILDGVSLVLLLRKRGKLEERPLFWHFPIYLEGGNQETCDPVFRTRPGSVIRLGDWKLHEYFEDGGLELYNLKEDIGETENLIETYPEKAKELHEKLNSWREKLEALVPTRLNPEYDEEYDRVKRQK